MDIDNEKKEKYRRIFKGLPTGMKRALKEWECQDGGWDEATWIETVEALIGGFADYREAERWIRDKVLEKGES